MNRSLWPDGCEVHQVDLVRGTQDTIDGILVRYTSTNTMGIVAGLEVSPSTTDPTLLHIANGSGYSSNGELVIVPPLTSGQLQRNISLADPSNGAVNFVLAVYTEIYGDPQAHEDLGTTLPTSAIGSSRIVVLSASAWYTLPVSDPNLNNNARDRVVVLAIVTGTGGVLTQSNIQGPLAYPPVYNVSQPSTITGVHVDAVSSNSVPGSGILTYLTGPKTLQWTAPGDSIGLPTPPLSSNGTYTLYSNVTIYAITVTVTTVDLPVSPASIVNNINIASIYSQEIPRITAIDDTHRHMLGHGIPSTNNPHAMTLADIGGELGSLMQQHQVEMHANGIYDPEGLGASRSGLQSSIISSSGVNDAVRISPLEPFDVVYINGLRITSVTGSQYIGFDDVEANYISLYGTYMETNGTLYKRRRLVVNPGAGEVPTLDVFGGNVQPIDVSDYDATFDTEQDLQIKYDGVGNFALAPSPLPPGWPIWYVPYSNRDARGVLRLPFPRYATDTIPVIGAHNYIDVWIRDSFPPTPQRDLAIRIYNRPSPETSFLLSYVVSQGVPSGLGVTTVMLGWGLYGSLGVQRVLHVVDRRLYGTLANDDINNNTIGKEKIKDLSQEQVFNAIGYIPYNGGGNLSGFALRTGAPGANAGTTSHVMYADVAGSGGTPTTWASLSGRPTLLSSMSGDTTFTQAPTFNNGLTALSTITAVGINASDMVNAGGLNLPNNAYLTWGGFPNAYLQYHTGVSQIITNRTIGMNGNRVTNAAVTPIANTELTSKQYVDTVSAASSVIVAMGYVAFNGGTNTPTLTMVTNRLATTWTIVYVSNGHWFINSSSMSYSLLDYTAFGTVRFDITGGSQCLGLNIQCVSSNRINLITWTVSSGAWLNPAVGNSISFMVVRNG